MKTRGTMISKKDRAVWRAVLVEFDSGRWSGLCAALSKVCARPSIRDKQVQRLFHQLHTYKPRRTGNYWYWWGFTYVGDRRRRAVLRALASGEYGPRRNADEDL